MGNKLFGVDIAAELNKAMGSGLRPLTLIRRTPGTRTAGQLTGGTNPTETSHSGRGFVEDTTGGQREKSGGAERKSRRIVSILGDSLPAGIVPQTNDQVTLDGTTYRISGPVKTDPAAALYECTVDV